jgi:hypothetical protein
MEDNKTFLQLWEDDEQNAFVSKMKRLQKGSEDINFESSSHPFIEEIKKDQEELFLCFLNLIVNG